VVLEVEVHVELGKEPEKELYDQVEVLVYCEGLLLLVSPEPDPSEVDQAAHE